LKRGLDGKAMQTLTGEISPEDVDFFKVDRDGSLTLALLQTQVVGGGVSIRREREGTQTISTDSLYIVKHGSPIIGIIGHDKDDPSLASYVMKEGFDAPFESFSAALEFEKARYRWVEEEFDSIKAQLVEAGEAKKAKREAELAEQLRKRQDMEKSRDEYEARKRQEAAEGEAALEKWAKAHGSELLLARLEEGFDWKALARQEYVVNVLADAKLPAGIREGEAAGWNERDKPELAEIEKLREARKALGDKATVTLGWLNLESGEDAYGDTEYRHTSGLVVTITTPDKAELIRLIEI